jgi:hypothetical protein
MKFIIFHLLLLTALPSLAGVYGNLEFGDNRATVTRKLKSSNLVDQTMTSTLMGRTGLNGIFKCKAKLAGLTYRLYFDWNDRGELREITLRSELLDQHQYSTNLYKAWQEASELFTQAYNAPAQHTQFPDKKTLSEGNMLMSHVWHKGNSQSIMMGPGTDNGKYFLAIRFLNRLIEPVRISKS